MSDDYGWDLVGQQRRQDAECARIEAERPQHLRRGALFAYHFRLLESARALASFLPSLPAEHKDRAASMASSLEEWAARVLEEWAARVLEESRSG